MEGAFVMPQKSKVEIEEKVKGIRIYLAGQISMNELARKLGINWCTAATWVRNYQAEGLDAFIRHKNHIILRKVLPLAPNVLADCLEQPHPDKAIFE